MVLGFKHIFLTHVPEEEEARPRHGNAAKVSLESGKGKAGRACRCDKEKKKKAHRLLAVCRCWERVCHK